MDEFDKDTSFISVEYDEFSRLRRLCNADLVSYMRERSIDGVYLVDDPTLRIVEFGKSALLEAVLPVVRGRIRPVRMGRPRPERS